MIKNLLLYFLICIGLVFSNTNLFAQIPSNYGISKASFTSGLDIYNVTYSSATGGTFINTSSCTTTGSVMSLFGLPASSLKMYSNFTNISNGVIYRNEIVNGSVTLGSCISNTFQSRFAVFIDLNQDGLFQSNEKVFQSVAAIPAALGTVYPFSFTIPNSALKGLTLMRIVANETTNNINATGTYNWGETEDYLVNIATLIDAGKDAHICGSITSIGLGSINTVQGLAGSYSYNWNNSSTLTGANTLNPIASPTSTTTYILSVLDSSTMNMLYDSVTVFVNQSIFTSIFITTCNQFIFNNQTLTASGIYYDTIQTALGCDSINELHLTIKNATQSILNDTIYAGSGVLFNNHQLSTSGIYYDTLINYVGCDSLVTLYLTLLPSTLPVGIMPKGYGISSATSTVDNEILNVSISSASGGTLNNSSTCSQTGSLAAINGLPASALSMYSNFTNLPATNIAVGKTINGSVTIGYCNSANFYSRFAVFIDYNRDAVFQSNERVYLQPTAVRASSTGVAYPFSFVAPSSASSGITLMRVVVIEVNSIPQPIGTYTWGETEDYIVNLTNSVDAGVDKQICGSITSIAIGGNPSIAGFPGAYSYSWAPTNSLNSSNVLNPIASPSSTTTYILSVLDSTTLLTYSDSMVVIVNQPTTTIVNQNACGSFAFNNQTLTSSGIYLDTLSNINGCDSIIKLNLIISNNKQSSITNTISAGSSILFGGVSLSTQGIYIDTISTYSGCDSIITLNLIVLPSVIPSNGSVPNGYGTSQAASSIDDEIYNVTIICPQGGLLNNSSTCSITGSSTSINGLPASIVGQYSNFTNLIPTNLVVNKTVSGSITIGFCNSMAYQTRFAIFIDYNRDGIFQSNETVYSIPSTVLPSLTGTVYPFSFTIPSNASPGLTLMRIVNSETSATITATSNYTWGETEDYLVNIGLSANAGADQTVCTSSSVTMNGSAIGGTLPYSYFWQPSTGLSATNIANPTAIVTANTTYTLTVTDSLGSISVDTIIITANTLPTITLSGSFASCSDTCVAITVGGSTLASWTWNISPSSSTLNSTSLSQSLCFPSNSLFSNISLNGIDANGCTNTTNYTVTRPTDCVWPGDANSDLIADNLDIFPIGLLNGTTGPVRNNASLVWIDQPATAYGVSASGFTNDAKHADCNGDGIIDGNDTTAILQNYGSTHLRKKSGADLLSVTVGPDTLYQNTTANIAINLGTATLPLDSIYGVAFSFNVDPTAIDTNSIVINANSSWLFNNPSDHFHLYKLTKSATRVDVGLVRNDHISKSGFGTIVNIAIDIITGNIVGRENGMVNKKYQLHCSLDNATILKMDGSTITANMAQDSSTIIYTRPNGVEAILNNNFSQLIVPNPATSNASIKLKGYNYNEPKQVMIIDAIGRIVLQKSFTTNQADLNLEEISQGIYIVKIISDKGITESKLIKH